MKKLGNIIARTVDGVFWVIMVLILISAVLSFSESITMSWVKYFIVFFSVCFISLFVVLGHRILLLLKNLLSFVNKYSIIKMCVIIFLFVALSKTFLVFLLEPDPAKHPDMATYQSFAYQLSRQGEITEYIYSAFMWKYEVIYGMFLVPIVKLFGENAKVLLIFLSILFALISVLLFDIVRVHVGKNKAFITIMLFNMLPVGLFGTQLLLHETVLLFFYVISFWFLIKSLDNKYHVVLRIFAFLLSVLLITFGTQINQGGMIVIISYCLYIFVVFCNSRITINRLVKLCSVIACYLLCMVLMSYLCVTFVNNVVVLDETEKQKIEQIQENELPYGWVLYLGANTKHSGGWNQEDAITYYKYQSMTNAQEAKQYQIDLIFGRYEQLLDNPLIIPYLLFNKLKGVWGVPLLQYWYGLGNSVNQFMLTGMHGIIHKLLWTISELTYLLLCTIIVFSHNRRNKTPLNSFRSPVLQFKMFVVGITLLLLTFEVAPKYVSHLQIVLFTIALFDVNGFCDYSRRVNRFIKR